MRQIYPPDLFVRRKKYDTPVFQSRHPALNEYISGAVKAIGEELVLVSHILESDRHRLLKTLQGNVDKVVVVVKDKEQVALERFIFSIQNMVQVEPFEKDSRFVLSYSLASDTWTSDLPLPAKYSGCHVRRFSGAILPFLLG